MAMTNPDINKKIEEKVKELCQSPYKNNEEVVRQALEEMYKMGREDLSSEYGKGSAVVLIGPKDNRQQYFHPDFMTGAVEAARKEGAADMKRRILNSLEEYLEHTRDCNCSQFSAGRPTEDGGYEQKFAGKWYRTRPIDETPKCNCGLDAALHKRY